MDRKRTLSRLPILVCRDMNRLALLIQEAGPRLAQMLGSPSFEITQHRGGHCSIKTSAFTVNFYRRPKSDVIDSSIELGSLPPRFVTLSHQLHTWLILKSRGEPWPQASSGVASQTLSDELDRVSRALKVVADDRMLEEALLYEAGYRKGWSAWG